jgi:hypothetical protein
MEPCGVRKELIYYLKAKTDVPIVNTAPSVTRRGFEFDFLKNLCYNIYNERQKENDIWITKNTKTRLTLGLLRT